MIKEFYQNQVIQVCSDYVSVAHNGQTRKNGITPYIVHPARVASMVSNYLNGIDDCYIWVAAAWLHDILEDCSNIVNGEWSYIIPNHGKAHSFDKFIKNHEFITPEDGEKILKAVESLTQSQDKTTPKKERKRQYYEKIKKASPEVSIIKYCDRIDNLVTVHHFSQGGFKWYIKDTKEMMDCLYIPQQSEYYPVYKMLIKHLQVATEKYKEMYIDEAI